MAEVLCPVLVGREVERNTLDAALDAVLGGEGRTAFITGEAGIGKSRLARYALEGAALRGATPATGRAVPTGGSAPFRPVTEALIQAFRDRPFPADPDLDPWRPALGSIVPALAGTSPVTAGEWSPAVRGEAVLRLLERLPGPVVMVLEDLHWADPDTLEVLEYLCDNLDRRPVLLVATARSEPPNAALDMARRVHGRRAGAHLRPGRLSDENVARMVEACTPGAGPELIRRAREGSEGIPFLVEEVLGSPGVPPSVAETVIARLSAFPPGARRVVDAAAVLGRHFDWRLLAPATGLPPAEVTAALELAASRLLVAIDVAGEGFYFRHALTREAVVGAILPPRRAELASALLAAASHPVRAGRSAGPGPARNTVAVPPEVAADLAVQAGDPALAGTLLVAAGHAALERGALATAIDTLARAAARLEAAGASPASAEAALLDALGLAGRVEEAITTGRRLVARLERAGAPGPERAAVHLNLAQAAVAAARWRLAEEHLAAAGPLLRPGPGDPVPLPDEARSKVLLAETRLAADDVGSARRLAEEVLALGERAAPETRCHALELVGRSERLGDLHAAGDAFGRAVAVADATGLGMWRLRALHELGTVEMFRDGGSARLLDARDAAGRMGAFATAAVLDLQLSAAAIFRFDVDAVGRHARSALAAAERFGLEEVRAKASLFLAEERALRGDREDMERWLARALASAPGDRSTAGFAWGCRGEMAVVTGDRAGALGSYRRCLATLRTVPHAEPALFRAVGVVVLAAAGDRGAGGALDDARRCDLHRARVNRGALGYAGAILAGIGGDPSRASELAAAADADLEVSPTWLDVVRLLAAEPASVAGWGAPELWLDLARRRLQDAGVDRLVRSCDQALSHKPPGHLARLGVTLREAEVLELVAQGLSNKEVAVQLRVSPRTAEKHVEALLRKTGARSRTELVVLTRRRAAST